MFTASTWDDPQTVTVTGVDNSLDDPGNRRTSVISHATTSDDDKYNAISGVGSVTVTVTDDDVPVVQFAAAAYTVGEATGDRSATVTVSVSPAPAVNTVVSYTVSGTAASGDDYTPLTGTATIAAGVGTVTIPVVVRDDSLDEPAETIILTLAAGTGYTLGSQTATTVTITDDDDAPAAITLSVDADTSADGVQTSVAEDDDAKTVRVTAAITGNTRFATQQSITVTVGAAADTATEGTDYESVAAQTITIPAGAASASTTFVLTPINDTLSEPTQSLSITGTLGSVVFTNTSIDITDDETVPSIALSVAPKSVGEGDGNNDGEIQVSVTATISGTVRFDADRIVTVAVADSDETGVVGFAAVDDFDVTIDAEATSGSVTFELVPTANSVDEDEETITIRGTSSGPPSATVTSAELMLTDDDTAGVTVSETALSVAEHTGTVTYTVVLDSEPTANVTVTIISGDENIVLVDGRDAGTAGSVSETLVFTPSGGTAPWDTPQTVTVHGVDDPVDNVGDEREATITHTISSTDMKYHELSGVSSVDVTVTDEDGAGLGLSVSALTVSENSGVVSYTVELDSPPTAGVTVELTASGAALLDGPDSDSTFTASETLTFTTTDWSTAQTVRVQGQNDDLDNTGNKRAATINHDVGSTDPNYSTIDRDLAVTVSDDDATPEINLSLDRAAIAENAAAADTVVTVTATVAGTVRFDTAKTVRVTVAGPSGDEYVDFTPPPAFEVTIARGAATGTATFTLAPVDDQVDETDATVTVSGVSAGLTVNEAELVLTDDETAPVVSLLQPLNASVTEGASAVFTLVATVASSLPLTVNLTVSETGAGDHVDADGQGQKTVTLPAYDTRVSYSVPTTDDSTAEAASTVSLTVRAGTGYSVDVSNLRSVTVTDDDTPATAVTLEVSNSGSVTEGGDLTVTARLAAAATANTVIPVTVANATTTNADHSLSPASVTITSGQIFGTVTLTATDDSDDEPAETLIVRLGALPSGYRAGTPSSVSVIITDNDATTVTLARAAGATLTEGGSIDHTLTLGRALAAGETLTVPLVFNTGSGAATRGSDYTLACENPLPAGVACNNLNSGAATVVFTGPSTASVTVTVTATADDTTETGETVNIGLGALTASGLGGGTSRSDTAAAFTIEDAPVIVDPPPDVAVTIATNSADVTEGGSLTVTVTLAAAAATNVAIPVTVVLGTATAADYRLSAASVDITSGASSGTVTLTAIDDNSAEPAETLTIRLGTMPPGYAAGTPSSVTVTIYDRASVVVPAVTVTQTGGGTIVAENTGTDAYSIVLAAEPSANVIIVAASSTPSAARIDGPDPGDTPTESETLTFTPGDYDQPRIITVTGINDNIDNPGERRSAVITHTITAASAAEYRNISVGSVAVTITDDDPTPTPTPTPPPSTPSTTTPGSGSDTGTGQELDPGSETEIETDFEDLDDISDTHREAVIELIADGTLENAGCDENRLCPKRPLTRWQLAVMLLRQLDKNNQLNPDGTPVAETDSDTPDGDTPDGEAWRAAYLERFAELGLTAGCDDTDGCGDQRITRAQAADYIVAAFGLPDSENAVFADVPQDAAHAAAINALRAAGITNGCSSEPLNYCPDKLITLQEFASLIVRTGRYIATEATDETGIEPVFADLDDASDTHREAVTEFAEDGSLDGTGCGGNRLCPRDPITAWEFAVILARRIDSQRTQVTADGDDEPDDDSANPASGTQDTGAVGQATDDWWAPYLRRLAELGVATICDTDIDTDTDSDDDGSCAGDLLTRAQAARLIAVVYNFPAADPAGFADTADNPHAAAIDAIHAAGITNGCSSEPLSFCPGQLLTRQQAVTMIIRATRHLSRAEPIVGIDS
ncbi:MAG: hypothetical protein OXE79_03400 [Acidimicrobiaceae bacterium]|nr:hypothetical protein [Acidimicrobiaceae bacterium]